MLAPDVSTMLQVAAVMLGAPGAAWAAVKLSLNGTRERVQRIETKLDRVEEGMTEVRERLARVEVQDAPAARRR